MGIADEVRRFASRDDWSAGRACFEARAREAPDDPEVLAALAFFVVKESAYDTRRGLELLERARSLAPGCALVHLHTAMIRGNLLEGDAAAQALVEARRCGCPEADLVRMRAWIDLDLWRVDEAVAGFRRLVDLDPSSSSAVLLATACLQRGDPQEALTWARVAADREPDDHRAQAYAGVALAALERLEEAREALGAALDLRPDSPLALHSLARVALAQDLPQEAESWLRRALDADPLYVPSRKLLADLCARTGRQDEARAHYEEALRLFADDAEARQALESLRSSGL